MSNLSAKFPRIATGNYKPLPTGTPSADRVKILRQQLAAIRLRFDGVKTAFLTGKLPSSQRAAALKEVLVFSDKLLTETDSILGVLDVVLPEALTMTKSFITLHNGLMDILNAHKVELRETPTGLIWVHGDKVYTCGDDYLISLIEVVQALATNSAPVVSGEQFSA